jgi:polysaccharide biosynthesis/export protein
MEPGSIKEKGTRKKERVKPRSRWLCDTRRAFRTFAFCLLPLAFLSAGCAAARPHLDRALLAEQGTAARSEGVAAAYRAGCPDVLEVTVAAHAELTGRRTIGPDGRIDLGPYGRPHVEGLTVDEIARCVAEQAAVPPARVQVRVAEFHSQQVYLIGQVVGQQRAVPYQGQETVLDLLKRVGGVTPGAASDNVYVVRSRVAEGRRPEVFHVDLRAVVLRHDEQTNVRLQPSDQVFVGETRRSCLERCFPPWLRPTYQAMCGLRRPAARNPTGAPPLQGPDSTLTQGPVPAATFRSVRP